MSTPLSLRAFGRLVGVSDTAIRKAIRTGRLRRGVGEHAGRPAIVDAEAARLEWVGNASRPRTVRRAAVARADASLLDVQRRIAVQRERRLRLENDVRDGLLVTREDVERAHRAVAHAVKVGLLAVVGDRVEPRVSEQPSTCRG